jgi:hypothetical protein
VIKQPAANAGNMTDVAADVKILLDAFTCAGHVATLLIKELLELDNMTNGRDKSFISRNQFMQNIVTAGKTDYKHYTGIMRI